MEKIKFIDLFCGLGGIRIGFTQALKKLNLNGDCVLSSDIKPAAVKAYEKNFNHKVTGDIRAVEAKDIEDFDFLLAGFPCQAFSSAGKRLGFEDTRGTLFFEVARILKEKQPKGFILENVEGLVSHDGGKTLDTIMRVLDEIGYNAVWKVVSSKDYGLAQNRKRIYIVGARSDLNANLKGVFAPSEDHKFTCLGDVREYNIPVKDSKINKILKTKFKNMGDLAGMAISDKRGGDNKLHSWDLELKGSLTDRQKSLMSSLVSRRRYKKWSIENGTAWFDGIPLSLDQIKTFMNYDGIESDLDVLVSKGYLRKDYPKDFKVIDGKKVKISREDLPLGYTMTTGKLSFEFSNILDDKGITNTIVATDASRLAVIEKDGIRKLTSNELKRLFGFPQSYDTSHLRESEVFDLFGNSVTVNVIEDLSYNLIKQIKL